MLGSTQPGAIATVDSLLGDGSSVVAGGLYGTTKASVLEKLVRG